MKLLNQVPNSTIDLIIADPPYFRINGEFDYEWGYAEEYIDWCKTWIIECARVLKKTGIFYLWGAIGYNRGYSLPRIAEWIERENLFKVINWITQRNTRGYANGKFYMKAREELVFMVHATTENYTWHNAYTSEKSKRQDLGSNKKPRKNNFKRCSDVWCDISEASQSKNQRFKLSCGQMFETVKNIKLCDRIIQTSSNEGDLVLVPFAGSGSEIISCINNNRNFIASELNPIYVNEIIVNTRFRKNHIKYTMEDNIIKVID